jgi:folate-binding protein YgfZ
MKIFNPDPEQYASAGQATIHTRLNRGVLRAQGADRLDLLHRLSTNATRELAAGDEATTILTSDKGRIVEVLRVVAFEDHIMMVMSGTDTAKVLAWLDKYTIMDDFTPADLSDRYALFGVYGERAKSLIATAFEATLPDAGKAARIPFEGDELVVLRDARLTGAGGFLMIAPSHAADEVASRLAAAGSREVNADTYETLRVEAGVPAIGREMTEAYNPLEAGLTQYISFTKGCYIGQEVIARLDTYDKVQRHLVGLAFDTPPVVGEGEELEVRDLEEGKKIGAVTSIAVSPALDRTIGLAYVRTNHAVPGGRVKVLSGDGEIGAVITKLPFDR